MNKYLRTSIDIAVYVAVYYGILIGLDLILG